MQALVAAGRRSRVPDDHVTRPISCCHPGRASSTLTLAPNKHDRWWICCSNFVRLDGARVVMKTNIRSLAGAVSDSRCPSVDSSHVRRGRS